MAVSSLRTYDVTDLCLGKPPLRCLSASSTSVSDAIAALKSSEDAFLSVWNCNHEDEDDDDEVPNKCECLCLGKISMADVICHLSKTQDPTLSAALNAPVSVLLPQTRSLVLHVQPSCSLTEAIDMIIQGAQNLVVPIQTKLVNEKTRQYDNVSATTAHSNGQRFCWITQEDIIQFLLGYIAAFSPLPAISISDLGIINSTHGIPAVDYYSSASSVISAVSRALVDQTSVAVVDGEGDDSCMYLIGEISPMTLTCCDETAASAVATLSAGDLMAYIDGANPPESLLQVVRKVRKSLEDQGLMGLLSLFESQPPSSPSSSSSSSEYSWEVESPTRTMSLGRTMSSVGRMGRKAEAVVCNPKSTLMAVMIQAIAHRVNYAWVVDKDGCFVGMVTFVDILKVFRKFWRM